MTLSIKAAFAAQIFTLPIRVVSEANARDHRYAKSKRTKQQRRAAAMQVKSCAPLILMAAKGGPITITLTRLIGKGGRAYDDDNLRSAFKAIRDGVANDALGIDDGSKRLVWEYGQERAAEFGVRIAIAAGGKKVSDAKA